MKKLRTVTLTEEQSARVRRVGFDYAQEPKTHIMSCNLCGSTYWTQIAHHDRYQHDTEAQLCNDCGNIFITPLMTEKAYHRFYADVYRPLVSAYHGRTIDAITLQEDQKPYAEDLVDFMRFAFRTGHHPKSILDVGGSTGIILKRIEKEFKTPPELLCLDPAVNELREAEKLGLKVINGFIETHDFGAKTFDLVLLCQTVDHLADIKKSLDKIYSILSTNGLFFVDFVDFRKIYLKTGSAEGAIKIDHCYYLTDATMEAYLEQSGFKILRKGLARDKVHVNYLCEKGTPQRPDLAPLKERARKMYEEIRSLKENFTQK